MPRARRVRVTHHETTLPDHVIEFLQTGEIPPSSPDKLRFFLHGQVREDWELVREELLAEWIARAPGTRPWGWWEHEQPKKAGSIWADARRRIGGSGQEYGSTSFGFSLYLDCSPADPPTVESDASYLKRHRILTAAEERRLGPKDFRPVAMVVDEDGIGGPDLSDDPEDAPALSRAEGGALTQEQQTWRRRS